MKSISSDILYNELQEHLQVIEACKISCIIPTIKITPEKPAITLPIVLYQPEGHEPGMWLEHPGQGFELYCAPQELRACFTSYALLLTCSNFVMQSIKKRNN